MLVKELRELLKKYKEDELRTLIVDIYKLLPKKVKEDKEIDSLIENMVAFKNKGKKEVRKDVDISKLNARIELFVEYAYNQYYLVPNRNVPKKERPKWRFTVKAFINDLIMFYPDTEDGALATKLLVKLYKMLSYACGYYLFNTENPFASVGIYQEELLDIIVKRMFASGIDREVIKEAVKLSVSSHAARDTLSDTLAQIPGFNLKTSDVRYMAVEQGESVRKEMLSERAGKRPGSNDEFWIRYRINCLVTATTKIYMDLCEYDNAVKYFMKNYTERDKEIVIYVLLDIFERYGNIEYWKKIYEDAVSKKIDLREELIDKYEYLVKNNKFGRG